MMHYDITVNDDCEIRLSVDQTFDEAQANQQTFTRAGTICQEMRTQVPADRKRGPKPGTGGRCDRELAHAPTGSRRSWS
jgi:hypothetical protein